MLAPAHHTMGMSEKPCAMLDASVSSPIMLFMTPVFPLSIPARHRLCAGGGGVSKQSGDAQSGGGHVRT